MLCSAISLPLGSHLVLTLLFPDLEVCRQSLLPSAKATMSGSHSSFSAITNNKPCIISVVEEVVKVLSDFVSTTGAAELLTTDTVAVLTE